MRKAWRWEVQKEINSEHRRCILLQPLLGEYRISQPIRSSNGWKIVLAEPARSTGKRSQCPVVTIDLAELKAMPRPVP